MSPQGEPRNPPGNFAVVASVIDSLLGDIGVDFLALGEISNSDISEIRKLVADTPYEVTDGVSPAGRSRYSTCFLTNTDKLVFTLGPNEVLLQEGFTYRLAQRGLLISKEDSHLFHLLVSHWPSRMSPATREPLLCKLGDRLRQTIDKILEDDNSSSVVLMGDYNDEPFDDSVSYFLRATRDRDLVKKRPSLLYNPFWRHLCHPEIPTNKVSNPKEKLQSWGTYFHQGGSLFRWRTFDQMIFSSSFLESGDWHLNEEKTQVVDIEQYTTLVLSRSSHFDHLPIMATLERKHHG